LCAIVCNFSVSGQKSKNQLNFSADFDIKSDKAAKIRPLFYLLTAAKAAQPINKKQPAKF
jgi:hypothetical protein